MTAGRSVIVLICTAVVVVLAGTGRSAKSAAPTLLHACATASTASAVAQCCTNTCWHGYGCCGCTGACTCPCKPEDCSKTCPSGGSCGSCSNQFGGTDYAISKAGCNMTAF
ncbi:MAG: hypothetical protein AABZ12_02305 [Planctomycetota bacterium]